MLEQHDFRYQFWKQLTKITNQTTYRGPDSSENMAYTADVFKIQQRHRCQFRNTSSKQQVCKNISTSSKLVGKLTFQTPISRRNLCMRSRRNPISDQWDDAKMAKYNLANLPLALYNVNSIILII